MSFLSGLKQSIKHKVEEAKEAGEAYKKARHEEKLRVQHLKMQKKMYQKKERIAKASEPGIKSVHASQVAKEKSKEKLSKASKKLKELAEKAKQDPFLRQLAQRAAQEAKHQLFGEPRPRRRHKKKSKKKRRY